MRKRGGGKRRERLSVVMEGIRRNGRDGSKFCAGEN